MYRRITRVGIPIGTFIGGVVAQLIFDRLTNNKFSTSTRLIAATTAGLVIVVVILAIVVAFDYADRLRQFNLLGERIEGLSRLFGLSVEFIEDHPGADEGLTYERTRQLISQAQRSIVFVDFYAESGSHRAEGEISHLRRQAYYEEILHQIEIRTGTQQAGAPFHRRIIQADLSEGDGNAKLSLDDLFVAYLRRCLAYQEISTRATVLKVCPPLVYMHFAVIDGRYIILPILTSIPASTYLRRHGALIFEDRTGVFASRLMHIYDMLDATTQPLTEQLIGRPQV